MPNNLNLVANNANVNLNTDLELKALFTDLDGTLLYKDKISQKNILACKKLINLNIPLIFNTGRDVSSVKKYLAKTGLDKVNGYLSCTCGSLIYKLPEMQVVKDISISPAIINEFVKECLAQKINFTLYSQNTIYLSKRSLIHKMINKYFSNSKLSFEYYFDSKNNPIKIDKIYKIVIYFPGHIFNASKTINKINYIKDKFKKNLEIYVGDLFFSEITDISANKGNAVEEISKLLNIDINNVAFIGDGNNDISAIKKAGFKIALVNSIPEIIQQANFIAPHCKKNGFNFVVNKLFLIKKK